MLLDEIMYKEPIKKGWSCDKKYAVTTKGGVKYLLRITPFEKKDNRSTLFKLLKEVSKLDIPMCQPIEFGTCKEGIYTFYTWIEGEDAEKVIPLLTKNEQYTIGIRSGIILKNIHSLEAPSSQEEWHTLFRRITDYKIQSYMECGVNFQGDKNIINYLKERHEILKGRPQSFQHGDYHIGNMMIQHDELIIIDFDRFQFGDPWEDFNRIVWCAQSSPMFASGMVDGYFNFKPPKKFWECLAYYIGSNMLSSIYWALGYSRHDLDVMLKQSQDVRIWYDDYRTIIPSWYKHGMHGNFF